MTGFLVQMVGAAVLFAVIEALEGLIRGRFPGRRNRTYSLLKLCYGLPLVLLAGDALLDRGIAIQWAAVAAGIAIAATVTLVFFTERREVTR
ncbi:MAG: hypothetical protein AAGB10_11605 [Pseudomonadota bacterium]